jgi:hypothetical protein
MPAQASTRGCRRRPTGDIPVLRASLPRIAKRRRPQTALNGTGVSNESAAQGTFDAEEMLDMVLQAASNQAQASTSVQTSAGDSSQPGASPRESSNDNDGNDNGGDDGNTNEDNNENNNEHGDDRSTDPPPPPAEDTAPTTLPAGTNHSQIPCRYHGLPGGYSLTDKDVC